MKITIHVENIFVDDERLDIYKVTGTCIFFGNLAFKRSVYDEDYIP